MHKTPKIPPHKTTKSTLNKATKNKNHSQSNNKHKHFKTNANTQITQLQQKLNANQKPTQNTNQIN